MKKQHSPEQIVDTRCILLLLLLSFLIYFFYFTPVFLSPNSILSGITGDALKNYFTFSYHIKNDPGLLHFSGMNFPFGEHVVYTDCQPLLTFILRCLPFTHNHLVGILHLLLFFSFIIVPSILYKIFRRQDVGPLASFGFSLAITLLAPQFQKINGGHHGLAYGCSLPLGIFLIFRFFDKGGATNLIILSLYNTALFFIHPYIGFSLSFFSAIAFFLMLFFSPSSGLIKKHLLALTSSGMLPVIFFKVFMLLTDTHKDRTEDPGGKEFMVENFDSLLAPDFGPFQTFLESVFTQKTHHLEGHSYLGLSVILLSASLILLLFVFYKRFRFNKEMTALFISSAVLLCLSFGLHHDLMEAMGIRSVALNQFRAASRLAWMFYFMLPLFVITSLNSLLREFSKNTPAIVAIIALLLNLTEAHFFFRKDKHNFWKFRNILAEKYLTENERILIHTLKNSGAQAIITLPVFHIGSEMYSRSGDDKSMIPAMMYAYHTAIPIFGVAMSRTSISETAQSLSLLNSYCRDNISASLEPDPFVIIRTNDEQLEDEKRLASAFRPFWQNDSLQVGIMPMDSLRKKKFGQDAMVFKNQNNIETADCIFIGRDERKPFIPSLMKDNHLVFVLDSHKLRSGRYLLSFHYYSEQSAANTNAVHIMVDRKNAREYFLEFNISIRRPSGFYKGYTVSEHEITLDSTNRYEFSTTGFSRNSYYILNFMLRPANRDVLMLQGNDTLYNNFRTTFAEKAE